MLAASYGPPRRRVETECECGGRTVFPGRPDPARLRGSDLAVKTDRRHLVVRDLFFVMNKPFNSLYFEISSTLDTQLHLCVHCRLNVTH